MPVAPTQTLSLQKAVLIVAIANFAYFFVEYAVAKHIQSVSLFADSIDFLEDTAINFLILIALGWSARKRAIVGMLMAALIIVPTVALVWTAWQKFHSLLPPEPWSLSITGLGALIINLGCTFLLARFKHHSGSLTRAAFLSARNDAYANLAIITAGGITLIWASAWPDLIVGICIGIMNMEAAKEVWEAARKEQVTGL
jgi:Co/Zn/Cd efflux system component